MANLPQRILQKMAKRGVVGDGDIISANLTGFTQSSPVKGTGYDDATILTVPPGQWMIYLNTVVFGHSPGSISGDTNPFIVVILRTVGGTDVAYNYPIAAAQNGVFFAGNANISVPVNIATTTSYKVTILWASYSGTPTLGSLEHYVGGMSMFKAIRRV